MLPNPSLSLTEGLDRRGGGGGTSPHRRDLLHSLPQMASECASLTLQSGLLEASSPGAEDLTVGKKQAKNRTSLSEHSRGHEAPWEPHLAQFTLWTKLRRENTYIGLTDPPSHHPIYLRS